MSRGKIVALLKKVGDAVSIDDPLLTVEGDKATTNFPSLKYEGFVARVLGKVGDVMVPGDPVYLLVDTAEEVNAPEVQSWTPPPTAAAAPTPEATTPAQTVAKVAAGSPPKAPSSSAPCGGIFASPLARVTAEQNGLALSSISFAGRCAQNPIAKADVDAALSSAARNITAAASVAASVDVPVTPMREVIAKRLTQSKIESPHYYMSCTCVVDNMKAVVKQLNAKQHIGATEGGDGAVKIGINEYILKAVSRACRLVPAVNSSWLGTTIREYKSVDISVAVATPTGLITPIIRDVDTKGLGAIAKELKALVKRARAGDLTPDEYQGGTFTVSNLGSFGVESFTAIINAPQSAILACGTIVPRPVIATDENGKWVVTGAVEETIQFTASFDHRVVDGAVGGEWMKHFKDAMENPLSLLL